MSSRPTPRSTAGTRAARVNTAIETGDSGSAGNVGIGFAVPINTVRDVVAELKEKGRVDHPFIGIEAQALDDDIAELFRLPVKRGLLVEEVMPETGAAKAGLRGGEHRVVVAGQTYMIGGDIIVKADGTELTSMERLRDVVSQKEPGDEIELEIYRGQDRRTIEITLGRQPPTPQE
jgi:S1-C subfamily serine protease